MVTGSGTIDDNGILGLTGVKRSKEKGIISRKYKQDHYFYEIKKGNKLYRIYFNQRDIKL